MPSERFHNLKPIKKRNFLKMAYREFALHSYEGASITRLVSDLKMAKGSIYQYFEGKQDLYNYLLEHANDQMEILIKRTCPAPNSTDQFDSWFEKLLLIQVKFLLTMPNYALLFSKNQTEFIVQPSVNFIDKSIETASLITGKSLTEEELYILHHIPLRIFSYVLISEKYKIEEVVNSDSSISISTTKLLYLCEAFLRKA